MDSRHGCPLHSLEFTNFATSHFEMPVTVSKAENTSSHKMV